MRIGMAGGVIALGAVLAGRPVPAAVAVSFQIDLGKENHAISPLIYGSNSGDITAADGVTFRRSGGNRLTGYNWENNASSAGTDYNNSSDGYLGGGDTPGKAMTDFQDGALAEGAATVITLPAAGYVSKDKKGTVAANEVAPSARWAKGVFAKGKAFTAVPDAADGEVYTDEFADFMAKKYGDAASAKGVKYYEVDNEPGLWPSTHPLIHPAKTMAVELVQKTRDLAIAVKKVDPKVGIFGGVFYGYNDFASLQDAPDWKTVNASGKYAWYLDYFLEQTKQASDQAGLRLVDVLDLHWYPEATGDGRIANPNTNSANDVAARLQAPRSLWDSTYTEKSWISNDVLRGPINLLPRVFRSIAKYNPGTKVAITEYNYGAADKISGGLAEADFLGVMGKTGVFAAAFWQLDSKPVFASAAFRLFRNYDGKQGRFGSLSAAASASNADQASVFAAYDPGGDEVHIIAINKNAAETIQGAFTIVSPVPITQGRVFAFDASGAALTERNAVASVQGNGFSYALPPLSASHFILKTNGSLPSVALRAPLAGTGSGAGRKGSRYLPDGRRLPAAKSGGKRISLRPAFLK